MRWPTARSMRIKARSAPVMASRRAVPGAGLDVPVWILGSSLFGARGVNVREDVHVRRQRGPETTGNEFDERRIRQDQPIAQRGDDLVGDRGDGVDAAGVVEAVGPSAQPRATPHAAVGSDPAQ